MGFTFKVASIFRTKFENIQNKPFADHKEICQLFIYFVTTQALQRIEDLTNFVNAQQNSHKYNILREGGKIHE